MKNFRYHSLLLLAFVFAVQAHAAVNIAEVTPTDAQNYWFYASPNDVEEESASVQKIVTGADYIWSSPTYRMQHIMVECIGGPEDFAKGRTDESVVPLNGATVSAVLPARAKVAGLALPGWLSSMSIPDRQKNLYAFLFLKNLDEADVQAGSNPPYINKAYAEFLRFLNAGNGYEAVIAAANRRLRMVDEKSAENPHCLDMMFDKPYEYKGGYINLAIDLICADNSGVESASNNAYGIAFEFPKTRSQFQGATTYHTMRKGGLLTSEFTFYKGCEDQVKAMVQENWIMSSYYGLSTAKVDMLLDYFNFDYYTLPAFELTYYTNDLRGRVTDENGDPLQEDVTAANVNTDLQPHGRPLIRLFDLTDSKYVTPDHADGLNSAGSAEVQEDGTFCFSNLDHSHRYRLAAASSTCGLSAMDVDFADGESQAGESFDLSKAILNDLECRIVMSKDAGVATGISTVDANRRVVSTVYCNPAGQVSDRPFDGVNVVVTTCDDGSRNIRKVLY